MVYESIVEESIIVLLQKQGMNWLNRILLDGFLQENLAISSMWSFWKIVC